MLERKKIVDILIIVMTIAMVVTSVSIQYKAGYTSGFNMAKSLVENSIVGAALRTPDDVRTLFGTVTAINGTRITLHTVSNNPFDDSSLGNRTILVSPSTKITKLTLGNINAFQDELAAYTKILESKPVSENTPPSAPPIFAIPEPPTFATPAPADLASIKVGDALIVTASENIKSLKEFTASEIQIQLITPPPTAPQSR